MMLRRQDFVYFCAGVMLACSASAQHLTFTFPVAADVGKDVFLVNHVDHDTTSGRFHNYQCKVYTYDGHDGTDFVLRSFRQMDSGVAVIAAADGIVTAVVDSLYDRNKASVVERGFGNYISIKHDEGYITYYAHLKTGSVLVEVGQRVDRAQPIALVGSSGNSSDPHLHFEVWRRVDPFSGTCGDAVSRWDDQYTITGEHHVVDHDLTSWPPVLDTIRERPPHESVIDTSAKTITAWSLHNGINVGDLFAVTWYMPSGATWFTITDTAAFTTNYYYWWSFIDYSSGTMPPGQWQVAVTRNGSEIYRDTFQLATVVSVDETDGTPTPAVFIPSDASWYTLDGVKIDSRMSELSNGMYIVRTARMPHSLRILIRDGNVCGIGSGL